MHEHHGEVQLAAGQGALPGKHMFLFKLGVGFMIFGSVWFSKRGKLSLRVLAVKQALQEKEGIQVDQIRLIHSGKQLADDKTLESYNIVAGATIHMVLQLRGGSN